MPQLTGWWVYTGPAPTESSSAQIQRLFENVVETIAIDTTVDRQITVRDADASSSEGPREIVAQTSLVRAGGGDDSITFDLGTAPSNFNSSVGEQYFRLRDWRSDVMLQSAHDLRSPWHAVSRYVLAHTPTDQLPGGFFNLWLLGDQQSYLGGFVDAGGGDDFVTGSSGEDVFIGGDGNDDIDGLGGSDTYLYTADEIGVDALYDDGSGLYSYLDWFYWNQGVANWDERMVYGGLYRSDLDYRQALEGPPQYFATKQEARRPAEDRIATFVPSLSVGAPIIRRTDTATLESLMDAGVLPRDVVKFAPNLSFDDLEMTITPYDADGDIDHPETVLYHGGTLSVRWGDAGFDIEVPDVNFGFELGDDQITLPTTALELDYVTGLPVIGSEVDARSLGDYRLGQGIDDFLFADGTSTRSTDSAAREGPKRDHRYGGR